MAHTLNTNISKISPIQAFPTSQTAGEPGTTEATPAPAPASIAQTFMYDNMTMNYKDYSPHPPQSDQNATNAMSDASQTGTYDVEKEPLVPESIQCTHLEPQLVRWTTLADMIDKHDAVNIQDFKDDIDTLLVFAGLFSAVVTAFLIESYNRLKEHPVDSATVLMHISSQLESLTVVDDRVNSSVPAYTQQSRIISPSPVVINTLWSASLITALITASLAILVKGWFREYINRESDNPHGYIRIRFLCYERLSKWRAFDVAAFLPVLLQSAVIFFLLGLSLFLCEINPLVGCITTGVVLIWEVFFLPRLLLSRTRALTRRPRQRAHTIPSDSASMLC